MLALRHQFACNVQQVLHQRCNWRTVSGVNGTAEGGVCDGVVLTASTTSNWQLRRCGRVGLGLLVFGVGWMRKARGQFAELKAHGVRDRDK